ncbi:MAG: beta strand repeat-containing protein, partial [Microcystis panniformis]
ATFTLKNNVGIYGGFAGTETAQNQRNINTNVTILSGEIGVAGIADNVYHVVTAVGSTANPLNNTILDGFTITGGSANGTTGNQGNGGGVYVSGVNPILNNIIFRDNNGVNGGALYNENGSNPILTNVLFEYNNATKGAGIYNDLSSPQITDGTFRLNVATNDGGAIYNTNNSNPTLVNTVFSRNTANTGGGGAVYNNLSNPTFINSTFSGNAGVTGAAINDVSSSPILRNSILWGNYNSSNTGKQINDVSGSSVAVTKSIIQGGGYTGLITNNSDPLFVNPKADDLRLKSGSAALDTGDANLLPSDSRDLDGDGNTTEKIPLDLANNLRVAGANVDLGAYEGAQLAPVPTAAASRLIYVRSNAGGSNNGTSWTDAFTSLQDALAAARSGDTIWVAGGTYKPTITTDRTATFTLKNQVEIYGGFAGSETSLSQRDIVANPTILSGDIGTVNNAGDNVYHVLTANLTTNAAVLDGFTISGGNANGTGTNQNLGGGLFNNNGSPTLRNVIFENNNATNGGGIYDLSASNPSLNNVTFRNNTATLGGAIYNKTNSNPTITNSVFFNNSASNQGGAIYNENSSPILSQFDFKQNSATNSGGAIYNQGSSPTFIQGYFRQQNRAANGGAIYNDSSSSNINLTNVSFIGNVALTNPAITGSGAGGAIYNNAGQNLKITNAVFSQNIASSSGGAIYQYAYGFTITNSSFSGNSAGLGSAISADNYFGIVSSVSNSIFWGNSATVGTVINGNQSNFAPITITNSIVQGGYTGTGNLNVDPLFVATDDLHLQSNSPAINAGNNNSLPTDNLDLNGNGNTTEKIPFDFDRTARINGANVDLGAYEYSVPVPVNHPPVVNNATFTLLKTSPLNTTVGTVTATDSDNDTLTYSITAGNLDNDGDKNNAFKIDNKTGVITVNDPDDILAQTNSFSLTATANDGQATGSGTITINLTNPNQPPVIIPPNPTFSVAKRSPVDTVVGTVKATDPDNNTLTYSITSGNFNLDGDGTSAFKINSSSGVISVADTDDINAQTTTPISLVIQVSDGQLNASTTATINITNPVNRPPVVNDAVFSISKTSPNGTVVGTINATDPDNDPLTYSITAGNPDTDGDGILPFEISSKTGVITVKDKDDILAQTNPFNLTIQASDGALNATGIATINLNNVNPLSFQLKLYEDNNGT